MVGLLDQTSMVDLVYSASVAKTCCTGKCPTGTDTWLGNACHVQEGVITSKLTILIKSHSSCRLTILIYIIIIYIVYIICIIYIIHIIHHSFKLPHFALFCFPSLASVL